MGQHRPDLEEMEKDYRAGVMSNCEIARKYDSSEGTVRYYARMRKWERDPSIRKHIRKAATAQKFGMVRAPTPAPYREPVSMEGVVEHYTELASEVVTSHRRSFGKLRSIVNEMARELTEQMTSKAEFEESIVEYFSLKAAGDPVLAAQYKQQMQLALAAVSLGSRSKTLLNIAGSLEKLVKMERESFGLATDINEKTYEDYVREIDEKARKLREIKNNPDITDIEAIPA